MNYIFLEVGLENIRFLLLLGKFSSTIFWQKTISKFNVLGYKRQENKKHKCI